MPSKAKRLRQKSALAQSHRCYYCGLPIWEQEPEEFAKIHQLSLRQAMLLRCTAEHLHSRAEGGGDCAKNIVAACTFCNGQRHRRKKAPAPDNYRKTVRLKMQSGKWLVAILPKQFVIGELASTITRNT